MYEAENCPCCGAALPVDDRIFIDLDGGFIASGGKVSRLKETPFNLFMALWKAKPRAMTREQLLDRLYQLRPADDEPEAKIVDVFVCHIRKALQPLGIQIETVRGRGYRIKPKGNDQ